MDETILNCRLLAQQFESVYSLIYRAEQAPDNTPVILKMLKPQYATPEHLARFWQEYELTRRAQADGVIHVRGIEPYKNTFVMVFEDVGGDTLANWMACRRFSLQECLALSIKIADSISQIHAANIIHKHLNPANILWNPQTEQLKITNFGMAALLSPETPALTQDDLQEIALPYISPEQTGRMNRALDFRADLYSFGVVLYELLLGHCPFDSDDSMEIIHSHLAKHPVPPHLIDPLVPEQISAIVMRLLEKNTEDRYQSAVGVRYDLAASLAQFQNNGSMIRFELGQKDFSNTLHIPQKLYGRERDIEELFAILERTCDGQKELALVSGYAGVGKSAFVREMQKPVTQRRGYFVEGKFDQYQRNIPYSGWIQAFTGVINQLLTESETQLVRWKTTILAAIGSTGKVLTDVIPPLELIIGVQPELPQLGGAEAQNRFHHTLRHFVRVITQDGRPLVIFLDDIHWIDAASLKLLHVLLSDSDARYLLIIGAYRDNEVDAAHPLHAALETLRKERVRQESLTLRNLAQEDINAMIADALHCSQAACETLALAVYSKTAGNAFFTRQLLHALAEQGVLSVDVAKLRWKWDLPALKAMNITENVVEFLVQKIQKLPAATQRLLMLAACVGNQFDVTAVTIVAEKPESTLWRDMHIALQEGFIFHLAGQYKFAHDRIQQAAYSLIPADERSARCIGKSGGCCCGISRSRNGNIVFLTLSTN